MRPILLTALLFVCAMTILATGHSAEPAREQADPWVGTYRGDSYGNARQATVTITKGADGYYLSKPYDGRKFTEVEKGVLSDVKGGLGRIILGTAKFADGTSVQVLRGDFCYEQFILYGGWDYPAERAKPKGR